MRVTLAEEFGKALVSFDVKVLPSAGDFVTYKIVEDKWEEEDDEPVQTITKELVGRKGAEGTYIVELVHHAIEDGTSVLNRNTRQNIWLIVSRIEETAPADEAF